jgi:hypothetical protein
MKNNAKRDFDKVHRIALIIFVAATLLFFFVKILVG